MRLDLVIAMLGSLLISGCSTYSLEKLRNTTPQGNAFQSALAKLYMNFADSEEKDYDWQDSWYFADKGLLAAYGKDTLPEELDNWNIPPEKLAHLKKGREDLLELLTPKNMAKKPEIAARAQFYFDCWMEQQEENWQKDDIEACRDNFVRALAKLDAVATKKSKKTLKKHQKRLSKKTAIKPTTTAMATMPTTTSFMLFFSPDSTALTTTAESVMNEVINTLAKEVGKDYEVVIVDKSATRKNHLELSLERVQAVKHKLLEAGIGESVIVTGGSTGKQATRQTRRKIEILLND